MVSFKHDQVMQLSIDNIVFVVEDSVYASMAHNLWGLTHILLGYSVIWAWPVMQLSIDNIVFVVEDSVLASMVYGLSGLTPALPGYGVCQALAP